eukprot:m.24210 g.24210  ORF g.24210 m.24210 type:complete len:55 (-) comp8648_c0_seq1:52-216(-)
MLSAPLLRSFMHTLYSVPLNLLYSFLLSFLFSFSLLMCRHSTLHTLLLLLVLLM